MSSVISKSVARGFAVLELFARERRPLTAGAVEAALQIPQPSALVLLRELVALGYLAQDRERRTYFPTERVAGLGGWLSGPDLAIRRLRPLVDEIARVTHETTSLCTRIGRFLRIDYFVPGTLQGSVIMHSGRAAPLPCSGAGRAVLSLLEDREVEELIAESLSSEPPRRFRAADVRRDVRAARRNGVLITYDLMIAGVGAVAFPLPLAESSGTFAIVVAAPSPRIRTTRAQIERACEPVIARFLGRPALKRAAP